MITTPVRVLRDKNVAYRGKDDVPVATQPTTRGGLRVYKIVVLGDGGVGKSAVTLQFVNHRFLDYHDPTIEDSYQKQAVIDGEPALLDILDTAGQVEFTAMREQYMRCGEGFMICYSVTDLHSFQEVMEYKKLISRVRANEEIPVVLVGNKFDLQQRRKVSMEEGKALAKELGCPFYETSAALRQFVDDAFYSLVRQIRAKERRGMTIRKTSRWGRLRSIFSLIFRRRKRTFHTS
ncbi:GTP-binding protein Rit2 isoform X1 [Harpegnathos saltator]|uniref:small monomeric GTPase n=1 Tax=Harpegnathos saltator TaxID=610380 RepID=E2BBL8_HARSA|nr:GTP-binding protein Rit2 isoform X1 [Harpegnathos saltator]EFN86895.1 GTP-binding protein Rit1 [Harpegnathos saltator]